jgi:hypothetical protein
VTGLRRAAGRANWGAGGAATVWLVFVSTPASAGSSFTCFHAGALASAQVGPYARPRSRPVGVHPLICLVSARCSLKWERSQS